MKKILIGIYMICISALLLNVTVFGESENINVTSERSSGNIYVSGNTGLGSSQYVFVMITGQDEEKNNIFLENIADKAYAVGQCTSEKDGGFEIILHLRESYRTGTYKCIAISTGNNVMQTTFEYYSPYDIKNVIKKLNGYDLEKSSEFISLFEENMNILGTEPTLYNNDGFDKNELAKIMITIRPQEGYENEKNLNDVFYLAEYLIGLDEITEADTADRFILDNYKKLNVDERYTKASDTVRLDLCREITASELTSPDNLYEIITSKLPVSEFVNAKYWNNYKTLAEIYSDSIILDTETSEKLKSVNKDNVYQNMYKRRNNFKTIADVIDAYTSEIKNEYSKKNSHITNNGGGGGSAAPVISYGGENFTGFKEKKKKFSDLNGYEWAEEAINSLYEKNVISGYPDGSFGPAKSVSREEFVAMHVRLYGYSIKADISDFADVISGAWYCEALEYGVGSGIINGISDTEFGVGRPITRQDLAVMAYRAMKLKNNVLYDKQPNDFELVSDYAKDAVLTLYEKNIINGDENGNFRPNDYATRAEAAKILYLLK